MISINATLVAEASISSFCPKLPSSQKKITGRDYWPAQTYSLKTGSDFYVRPWRETLWAALQVRGEVPGTAVTTAVTTTTATGRRKRESLRASSHLAAPDRLTHGARRQYCSLMSSATYFVSLSISAILKSAGGWYFSLNQNVKSSLIWQ